MGKIVVADDYDVRKIVKEELVNFYNMYLKNEFYKIFTKVNDIDSRLYKLENTFK